MAPDVRPGNGQLIDVIFSLKTRLPVLGVGAVELSNDVGRAADLITVLVELGDVELLRNALRRVSAETVAVLEGDTFLAAGWPRTALARYGQAVSLNDHLARARVGRARL